MLIQHTPDSKPSAHTDLPYEFRTRNLTWMDLVSLAGILALGYISFSDVQDLTLRFDGTIGQTGKATVGHALLSHPVFELLVHSGWYISS